MRNHCTDLILYILSFETVYLLSAKIIQKNEMSFNQRWRAYNF